MLFIFWEWYNPQWLWMGVVEWVMDGAGVMIGKRKEFGIAV